VSTCVANVRVAASSAVLSSALRLTIPLCTIVSRRAIVPGSYFVGVRMASSSKTWALSSKSSRKKPLTRGEATGIGAASSATSSASVGKRGGAGGFKVSKETGVVGAHTSTELLEGIRGVHIIGRVQNLRSVG
jgi:hypothetical protein